MTHTWNKEEVCPHEHDRQRSVPVDKWVDDQRWKLFRELATVRGRTCLGHDWTDVIRQAHQEAGATEDRLLGPGVAVSEENTRELKVSQYYRVRFGAELAALVPPPRCCVACAYIGHNVNIHLHDVISANTQRGAACCQRGCALFYGRDEHTGLPHPRALVNRFGAIETGCLASHAVLNEILDVVDAENNKYMADHARAMNPSFSRCQAYRRWHEIYFPSIAFDFTSVARAIPVCVLARIRGQYPKGMGDELAGAPLYTLEGDPI